MFIERLTEEQGKELIEIVSQKIRSVTQISKIKKEHCNYSDEIECNFLSLRSKALNVHCTFCDFNVEVVNTSKVYNNLEYEIKRVFWEYMNLIFGKEYIVAYLKHKSKINVKK